jgi:hypothetical protein
MNTEARKRLHTPARLGHAPGLSPLPLPPLAGDRHGITGGQKSRGRGEGRPSPVSFEDVLRVEVGTYSGCRECGNLRKSCSGCDPLTMRAKRRTGRPRCYVYEIDAT